MNASTESCGCHGEPARAQTDPAYRRALLTVVVLNLGFGVAELFGEEGYSTRERTWARPTCDVNGIFGGYMGKGAKTVLPSWGGAKISMRLVPDQEPKKIAKLFL